ncbi:MAG: ABC transporter permease [Gammaproteobacteria bacterium]|nr:ABC transporter permease [Gammaproteobacteria bacterium]
MPNLIAPIAVYTLREAVRNRLFGFTLAGMVCLLGLTEFVGELAVTEQRQIQAALIGAGIRLFTVCTVCLFVVTSTVREFNDKGFELILSLPIPRASYFLGKCAGFLGLALIISAAGALLLLLYSTPGAVLLWYLSLAGELLMLIALSLLCLFTFGNVTVACVLVLAFYLLSRSMETILLVSMSPILETHSFSQEFMNTLVEGIAFVVPELHRFARSEWLIYGADWSALPAIGAQTVIYGALLAAAAMFDLYRKEL